MIETIARILSDHSVVLPTETYNEGWLLRLTLDWYYHRAKSDPKAFFDQGASWFSEGRLSSQFLPRWRGDPLAESHTNADGVIGHFDIAQRSEVRPRRDARQLLVLEAKLASKLSSGTTKAPGYDQAARSVACLAHIAGEAGIAPTSLTSYAFFVICPEKRVYDFTLLATKESVAAKVSDRAAKYGDDKLPWYNQIFLPHLEAMDVDVITWENLLADMESKGASRDYRDFYELCCEYAKI